MKPWFREHYLCPNGSQILCHRCNSYVGEQRPGWVTTHCPGGSTSRAFDELELRTVNKREWDFINGEWVLGELSIQAARVTAGLPARDDRYD